MKTLRFCLFFLSTILFAAGRAMAQSSADQGSWSGSSQTCCPVPEPGVLWLLLVGLAALVIAVVVKKRKSRKDTHSLPLEG